MGHAMNRAARRRQKAHWRKSIRGFHQEAAGVMRSEIVTAENIWFHPDGEKLFSAIGQWFAAIPPDGHLCLTCDHAWNQQALPVPAAFVVTRAWDTDATKVLVTAVCDDCLPNVSANFSEVCKSVFAKIWPDCRVIDAPSAAPGGLQ
jgi:hypothetical protein